MSSHTQAIGHGGINSFSEFYELVELALLAFAAVFDMQPYIAFVPATAATQRHIAGGVGQHIMQLAGPITALKSTNGFGRSWNTLVDDTGCAILNI